MEYNGSGKNSQGEHVVYVQLTEGDLYLMGFAFEALLSTTSNASVSFGAMECKRFCQDAMKEIKA